MDVTTNELTGKTYELLKTEVMFFVSSARSLKKDILKINIKNHGDGGYERRFTAVLKILKSLKRKGALQLYLPSRDFDSETTEVQYVKNKYPEMLINENGKDFILVKVSY